MYHITPFVEFWRWLKQGATPAAAERETGKGPGHLFRVAHEEAEDLLVAFCKGRRAEAQEVGRVDDTQGGPQAAYDAAHRASRDIEVESDKACRKVVHRGSTHKKKGRTD